MQWVVLAQSNCASSAAMINDRQIAAYVASWSFKCYQNTHGGWEQLSVNEDRHTYLVKVEEEKHAQVVHELIRSRS